MEVEPKTRKPSVRSWVSGTLCETAVWGDAKRWWVRVYDMELAVGLRVRQREARAGVEPKTQKLSVRGSVSGVPCKTAAREYGEVLIPRHGDLKRGGGE